MSGGSNANASFYYDSYEPGTFPSQEPLCEETAWTPYNLMGQRAYVSVLTRSPGNPLTIRLLSLSESLTRMLDCVEKPGREIGEAAETSFRTDGHFFMSSKFHGGDAGPDGRGAPVDKVQFTVQGWPRTVEFKWIEMHLALYAFFSNFGSILDRLSFEVNLMYELRARKVDWAKLLGVPPFPVKLLQALHEKDAKLADFVKSQAPLFEKAIGYRNRLVHDGLIEFNPEITHRGIAVWLRENPSDAASEMNVNALAFCGRTKADMLNLLNQSYSQMLAYFRANLSHTDVRS